MNRFISKLTATLDPYIPGEQPKDKQYIKLNTNESPYPSAPAVRDILHGFDYEDLRLYPDPDSAVFQQAVADVFGLQASQVFVGGGSDEVLGFAFHAFTDYGDTIYFPQITYSFYKVAARFFGLESVQIAPDDGLEVCVDTLRKAGGPLVIANPNAPTGYVLGKDKIEYLLSARADRLLILDEAYADFSIQDACIELRNKYDNLLIVRTMSKSYGLAGMRLAFALGNPALIAALANVKNAFNPYNLDRLSILVGAAAVSDRDYLHTTVKKITDVREHVTANLQEMGFDVLPSGANFLFIGKADCDGGAMMDMLKQRGILVRRFASEALIKDRLRVSIGTPEEMERFLEVVK
jgi:histidinol-phosphate aminotransferase